MEIIVQILDVAGKLSPIGVIGLLVGLLYLVQIQSKKVQQIGDNHLHEVVDTLQRMERDMAANFARILERLERFER